MEPFDPPNKEYPPPKPGEPPLHRAAREGDHGAIRSLAAAGADLNAAFDIRLDPGGYPRLATPLMVAAGSGDGASTATVALLLELGADPKLVLNGASATTFALVGLGWNYRPGGDAARARLLLGAGSPLPESRERANRLLCNTAAMGDPARVGLLLEQGFDARGHWDPVRARESRTKEMRQTQGKSSSPYALLPEELRASMSASFKEQEAKRIEQQSWAPEGWEIPLFRAAESGNAECVRLLIAAGADPKARDISQQTAMFHASTAEVVRVLIEAGLSLEDTDEYGWSPLVHALGRGGLDLGCVRVLLEAGADANATHDRGYTVLMSAVLSSSPVELRLLVDSGADPHAVSELGYNAFHAAVDMCTGESARETFQYLKDLGVDIEHRNKDNLTPLGLAVERGSAACVRILCELGADANAVCPKRECRNNTCTSVDLPLLFHAAAGDCLHHDAKTEALLRAGADLLAKDAHGYMPVHHAVASLCEHAAERKTLYTGFFKGLREVAITITPAARTRDEFVAEVSPHYRAYVERFVEQLPAPEVPAFLAESEAKHLSKRIACIVSLCAYRAWRWRERNKGNVP